MLRVCARVCVLMQLCVCAGGRVKCVADTWGLRGLGARAPGLLVQRATAWLDTLHGERERGREREIKPSTS